MHRVFFMTALLVLFAPHATKAEMPQLGGGIIVAISAGGVLILLCCIMTCYCCCCRTRQSTTVVFMNQPSQIPAGTIQYGAPIAPAAYQQMKV